MLPPAAASLDEARAAIELWEHYSRKTLDPSQRLVVEVLMATRDDGRWAARTTGREMARQNGKGDEIEVVELWGLVQRGERIGHTIHDAVLLATETQDRMLRILAHKDLRGRVARKWRGTGQQMIEMKNGGIIWYRTRTKGGLVGVDDVDRLVVDEAQFATRSHIEAITPTLLANDNPQLNVQGTAGVDHTPERSAWWWDQRLRALSDDPGDFGYVGHTAERPRMVDGKLVREPFDPADREVWRAANPALAAGRGEGLSFFEEQFRRLGPAGFSSQHLCVWNDPPSMVGQSGVIDLDAWEACQTGTSAVAAQRCEALTVSADRRLGWFAVAGRRADGRLHVEVGPVPMREVVERAVERWSARGVALRGRQRWPEIAERGVEMVEVAAKDYAAGVNMLIAAVEGRGLAHIGQRSLDAAVKVAQLSGSGVWVGTPEVDVAPLEAATLALSGVPQMAELAESLAVAYSF